MCSFRGCQGNECIMYLKTTHTICMMEFSNRTWDPTNPSRKLTCGLEVNDTAVAQPGEPVYGSTGSHADILLTGLPHGVHQKVFFACVRGKFQVVTRLSFPRSLADKYTCKENPMCIHGKHTFHVVCYTMEKAHFSVLSTSFASRSQGLWGLVITLAVWVLHWVYVFQN